MIASGSGLAIRLKLYVMAPIWTPPNLESIFFAPKAPAIGTDTNAIFPKSRLVNSILLLSQHCERLLYRPAPLPGYSERHNSKADGQVSNLEITRITWMASANRYWLLPGPPISP